MVEFEVPEVDYSRYSNRQLAAVPLAVFVVAVLILGGTYALTGAPVALGTEFTGGTELRVTVDAPESEAEDVVRTAFPAEPENVRAVPASGEYLVTFGAETSANDLERSIDCAGDSEVSCPDGTSEEQRQAAGQVEIQQLSTISATFGESVQTQTLIALAIAFLGMSLLVFAMFRTFVPSIAVVISAFSDITIALAAMNVFGIELSLGTVAALLMIIGYSVDSDILLNTHILRRSGGFYESTYRAMRTGVTMTLTSLIAMAVMAVLATAFGIGLLAAIGTILVFGLAIDLLNTYLLNLSLLRWYKFEGVAR